MSPEPVAPKVPPEEEESSLPQPSVLPPSTSHTPIKEGMVEKKGHSAAFLMWPKRWLKVCEGELHYCRPDDQENALNIIPLNPGVTDVKKVDSNGFNVTLLGSKRVFRSVLTCFQPLQRKINISFDRNILQHCGVSLS